MLGQKPYLENFKSLLIGHIQVIIKVKNRFKNKNIFLNFLGTLGKNIKIEKGNNVKINYEKLKRKDPIQFYSQIALYEDELADNGCAQVIYF